MSGQTSRPFITCFPSLRPAKCGARHPEQGGDESEPALPSQGAQSSRKTHVCSSPGTSLTCSCRPVRIWGASPINVTPAFSSL